MAHEAAPIVRLHGELDIAAAEELRLVLDSVAGSPVVVDLRHLAFADWAGISLLIEGRNRLRAGGRELVVANVPGQARRILELTGTCGLLGQPGPTAGERAAAS